MTDVIPSRPMLLLCAGFPRSGSTWLFNVLRIALRQASVPVYAAWVHDYDPNDPSPVHLVKVHDVCPLLERADAVFVSSRDLRDVVASLRLRGDIDDEPATIVDYLHLRLHHHGRFERCAHHHVVYERMKDDRVAHIAGILAALGVDGDPEAIHRAVEALSAKDMSRDGRYDLTNLLLQGHIQNGGCGYYGEVLSPESVESIERNFGAWLTDHGYATALPGPAPGPATIDLTRDEILACMIRDERNGVLWYWTPKCGCVNFLANVFRAMGKVSDEELAGPGAHVPSIVSRLRLEHLERFPVESSHVESGAYRCIKLVRDPYHRIPSAWSMLRRQRESLRMHARRDPRCAAKLPFFPELDYRSFLLSLSAPYREDPFRRQVRYHCSRMSRPEIDRHFEIVKLEESSDWFEERHEELFPRGAPRFDFEWIGRLLASQEHHNPTMGASSNYDELYDDPETLRLFHQLYAEDVVTHGYPLRQPPVVAC